jgi:alpha-tubulin suppressor-like RCC1 family protein
MPVNFMHTLILTAEGRVYSCGKNAKGQLGIGDFESRYLLTEISVPIKFISVSAGHNHHSVAVCDDGSLWGWGNNSSGELGLGESISFVSTPTKVPDMQNFYCVSAGEDYSLALDSNGSVWSYGNGSTGKLGLSNDLLSSFIPIRIPDLPEITKIAAGIGHSAILDVDGFVWLFGSNKQAQLGFSGNNNDSFATPQKLTSIGTRLVDVSVGYFHTMVLDCNNQVWVFGADSYSQFGIPKSEKSSFSPIQLNIPGVCKKISCGGYHCVALDDQERVWGVGKRNSCGFRPIDGKNDESILQEIAPGISCKDIIAAGDQTFVIDHHGNLYSCGYNSCGQLGLGDPKEIGFGLSQVPNFVVYSKISNVKSAMK